MKKGLVMVLAVAFLAVASTANAQVFGKGKAQFSLGLTQFVAPTVDTLAVFFFPVLSGDKNLLGFAGDFKYGVSDHWALDLAGYFGFGSDKYEDPTEELKFKYQAFGFRGGVDYTENIGEMFGVYFGPGFEFLSSRSSVEDPDTLYFGGDEDNPRLTTISLDGRVGVQAKLGRNFGLDVHLGQKFSHVSKTFDWGTVETKVTRWTSSMNGFAGFVIYLN